jgi:hypothetical protein
LRHFASSLAILIAVLAPGCAAAQERAAAQQQADTAQQARKLPPRRHGLLPFGAEAARRRGYELPLTLGVGLLYLSNIDDLSTSDLAVAFSKGGAPAAGVALIPVPFVTADRLHGRNSGAQFRADIWVLPNLNLFAAVGRMRGKVDVGVDIDLSQIVPPILCRDGRCDQNLRFKADVDNSVVTLGAIAVYGGQHWFGSLLYSRTTSVAAKDRSDISSTNAGLRIGPRFRPGSRVELTVYGGAQYLDLDTVIEGTVVADNVFADGDALGLRYRARLWNPKQWSALMGFNLQLARHWSLQAEYQRGSGTSRGVFSAGFRF